MDRSNSQPQIGELEYELGVPIPGVILPPEQWARTAVHRLPIEGRIDFEQLFGRRAPVVLEIGCGNGRFTVSSAVRRPEIDHLGIDILPVVIRYATRRAGQRGLSNARLAVCGGLEFLKKYVAPGALAEIHAYHPQPYLDSREKIRRLLSPAFLREVHVALAPGGKFFLQSDNAAYWEYLRTVVESLMDWREQLGPWPEDPHGRSRREIISRNQGLPIFRAVATRRDGMDGDELERVVQSLPDPAFEATANRNRTGWTRKRRK